MTLWWLSFCDADLPEGSQFLGACIVEGDDYIAAIQNAHRLGINPGGEVQAVEVPEAMRSVIPPEFLRRLMSRAECEAFDRGVSAN